MQIYQAYLLRVWRESESDPWRATLEDPQTGQLLGFSQAENLLAYLAQRLAVEPASSLPTPTPPPKTRPTA